MHRAHCARDGGMARSESYRSSRGCGHRPERCKSPQEEDGKMLSAMPPPDSMPMQLRLFAQVCRQRLAFLH